MSSNINREKLLSLSPQYLVVSLITVRKEILYYLYNLLLSFFNKTFKYGQRWKNNYYDL